MKFSRFASRFTNESGIVRLMDDLGKAMAGQDETLMLGGGNPSHIPGVQQYFRDSLHRLIDNPARFSHVVGNYESPEGNRQFIESLVKLMNKQYGWGITPENVALTIGSQSAFFYLFNMFGGEDETGQHRQVLLPITPEYIGYGDVALTDNLFYSHRPVIEEQGDHFFKYRIDFDDLKVQDNTAAMCVSRPTNPTGNVLTDDEVERLISLAESSAVPLIIDNAYGDPFPNIIFTETSPAWSPNIIYCMSLSKVGLPGARTGIVIANTEIIELIRNMNAIINLAPPNFGAMIAQDLVESGELLRLSQMLIKPYYQQKLEHALDVINREMHDIKYMIHRPEGAIFLWLWFPDLPVTTLQLYQRLKEKHVLVIPGEYFFPGLDNDDWSHKHQCLRVTYSMDTPVVEKGIALIADEIRSIMANGVDQP